MFRKLSTILILFLVVIFAAACSSTSNNDTNHEHANNEGEHEHDEAESHDMIPNDGAVIRLISPAEGATFTSDEEIVVEVEVENFPLGQDENGNHWHIFVGESEYAMVVGQNTSDVIRGLEPGEYTITVNLANGDHQDLEDGDSVTVTITE